VGSRLAQRCGQPPVSAAEVEDAQAGDITELVTQEGRQPPVQPVVAADGPRVDLGRAVPLDKVLTTGHEMA
jgi:hypothetical protein